RQAPLLLVVRDEGGELLLLVLRREAGLEPAERLGDERIPREEAPPVIVRLGAAVELGDGRRDLGAAPPVALLGARRLPPGSARSARGAEALEVPRRREE